VLPSQSTGLATASMAAATGCCARRGGDAFGHGMPGRRDVSSSPLLMPLTLKGQKAVSSVGDVAVGCFPAGLGPAPLLEQSALRLAAEQTL